MFMLARICFIYSLGVFTFFWPAQAGDKNSFQVVAYNVENLFDVDGVSLYSDYKEGMYGITELGNKLKAITSTLKKIGGTTGPEVILLQEIEVDRTPSKILSATDELLRELKLNGLGPYYFRLGYNPKDPPEKWPAVHCLTLSKFPIIESRLHPIERARPILETTIKINGHNFTLFNNHWKSGASSPEMELHRIQNAEVLRKRIDELVRDDPKIDLLVGGDLNSHYNQSGVYKEEMKETGINDRLLSSEIEPAGKSIGRNLYNLWHELPTIERGSDAWKGKWGTLMHILIPENLYDSEGIQYITDSFKVEKFKKFNEIVGLGIPFEWSNDLNGFGTSDHFPLSARFQTKGKEPKKGNHFPEIEREQRLIDYAEARDSAIPWQNSFLLPPNFGKTFQFSGIVDRKSPLSVKIEERSMGLYSFDAKTREILFSHSKGDSISGFGYLSRYRGQWQFIVAKEDWVD
jgi:endonuclease/exonuclease/phosphatase family metal-dependent hydrolase